MVAHPGGDSLTKSVANAVTEAGVALGADVRVQDLHGDGFDPRMPASEIGTTVFADALTAKYAADVLAADALVFVHPVWFFHVPGILKGWVDRVMREGVMYDLTAAEGSASKLRARAVHIFNTANSGAEVEAALGNQLERFWFDIVFGSAGLEHRQRTLFSKVAASSVQQREGWLDEAKRLTGETLSLFPA